MKDIYEEPYFLDYNRIKREKLNIKEGKNYSSFNELNYFNLLKNNDTTTLDNINRVISDNPNTHKISIPTIIPTTSTINIDDISSNNDDKMNICIKDAMSYLETVKQKLILKPYIYQNFLEIMTEYKNKKLSTNNVIDAISNLFHEYPDLIVHFNSFICNDIKISSHKKHFKPTLNYTKPTSTELYDHNINTFLDNTKSNQHPSHKLTNIHSTDDAFKYIERIKNRFINDPRVFEKFLEILNKMNMPDNIISEEPDKVMKIQEESFIQITKIFHNVPDLIDEFIGFLPSNVQLHLESMGYINVYKRRMPSYEEKFTKKIKENDIKVDKKEKNICDELPIYSFEWFEKNVKNKKLFNENLLNKTYEKVSNCKFNCICRVISLYNNELISIKNMKIILQTILDNNDDELINFYCSKISDNNDDKNICDNIGDNNALSLNDNIDFSREKLIGMSYWPYKKGFISSKCSGRTNLCNEVLNDKYISQPILSENSYFLVNKKLYSTEVLHSIEQERYENDLIIHSIRCAINYLEYCYKNSSSYILNELNCKKQSFNTINCIKTLQRIYGDNISIVLEAIKLSPKESIHIILKRLREKELWCHENRKKLSIGWYMKSRKNALKALDFQSTNYKLNELKVIKYNNIIKELKPINDSSNNGVENNVEKKIVFNNDIKIQNDVVNILYRYIVVNNKNEKNKIMSFIKTFNEWIFNIMYSSDDEKYNYDDIDEYIILPKVSNNVYKYCYIPSSIYIYIILYHILYEYIVKVKNMCCEKNDNNLYKNLANFYVDSSYKYVIDDNYEETHDEEKEDKYEQFLIILDNLLQGKIDNDQYEEYCYLNFGIKSSYILFNIDKIVYNIIKQVNIIISNISYQNYLYDLNNIYDKYQFNHQLVQIYNQQEFFKYWNNLFYSDLCYYIYINYTNNITITIYLINTGYSSSEHSVHHTNENSAHQTNDNSLHPTNDNSAHNTNDNSVQNSIELNNNVIYDENINILINKDIDDNNKVYLYRNIRICKNKKKNIIFSINNNQYIINDRYALYQFNLQIGISLNNYIIHYISDTYDIYYVYGTFNRSLQYFHSSAYVNRHNRFVHWWNSQYLRRTGDSGSANNIITYNSNTFNTTHTTFDYNINTTNTISNYNINITTNNNTTMTTTANNTYTTVNTSSNKSTNSVSNLYTYTS